MKPAHTTIGIGVSGSEEEWSEETKMAATFFTDFDIRNEHPPVDEWTFGAPALESEIAPSPHAGDGPPSNSHPAPDAVNPAPREDKLSIPKQKKRVKRVKALGTCPECGQKVYLGRGYYACLTNLIGNACSFRIDVDELEENGKDMITEDEMAVLLTGASIPLDNYIEYDSVFNGKGTLRYSDKKGWWCISYERNPSGRRLPKAPERIFPLQIKR